MMPETTDADTWASFMDVVDSEGAFPMQSWEGCDVIGDFLGVAVLGWLDDDAAREAVKGYHEVDLRGWLDDDNEIELPLSEVLTIDTISRTWITPLPDGWIEGGAEVDDHSAPATLIYFTWQPWAIP